MRLDTTIDNLKLESFLDAKSRVIRSGRGTFSAAEDSDVGPSRSR